MTDITIQYDIEKISINTKSRDIVRAINIAKIICEKLGDDPEREGPWKSWYKDSPYYSAALAIEDYLCNK